MVRKKQSLIGYGDVLGKFIRRYLDCIRPNIERGNFEGAAMEMEYVRQDYNSLGNKKRIGRRDVAKAYKIAITELVYFLELSVKEAKDLFRNEGVKKNLLSKMKSSIMVIDQGMSNGRNPEYEKHRKVFGRRLNFI